MILASRERRYGVPVRRASFLVLATLFAAGCGGGGGGNGGGPKRLSAADFATKADAICGKYNKQANNLGNPKTLAGLAKAFDKALPVLNSVLAELHGLKPPAKEQHAVDRWLAQSEVLKHDLTELRDRAKTNDRKGVESAFIQASGDVKAVNEQARKLGLKVCAKS